MTVSVYFDQTGAMSYPFTNPQYVKSYRAFAKLCADQGVTLFISRGPSSYAGSMKFLSGYQFRRGKLVFIQQPYLADVIFLKGYTLPVGAEDRVLNHPDLVSVCHDKLRTYKRFGQMMAPTWEITLQNYRSILSRLPTDTVVVKPVSGAEGKGIIITRKEDFDPEILRSDAAYFAQQFIDSREGIPGLVEGRHDLRLVLFNGVVKYSYIRQPREGSYLANIAQGGSFLYVPVKNVPTSAVALAGVIDRSFQQYTPRLYAVDLMYEQGRPYLVELNDQPGMPYLEENAFENSATRFHEDLLTLLTDN